jgi:hypothetical protein
VYDLDSKPGPAHLAGVVPEGSGGTEAIFNRPFENKRGFLLCKEVNE